MFKADTDKDTFKLVVEKNTKPKKLIISLTSYFTYMGIAQGFNSLVNQGISTFLYFFILFPVSLILRLTRYPIGGIEENGETFWRDY